MTTTKQTSASDRGKPERVLIVGSSGLLGGALVKQLQSAGQELAICNRNPISNSDHQQYRIEDLPKIKQHFDVIYLLAAHIPYGEMTTYSPPLIAANVALPLAISKQFPESRIVFSSSVSVYGTPLQLPITESHPYNQPNSYGMSKISAESILQAHSSFCILRFSSLFGEGMRSQTFLPLIIEQALRSGKIQVHGDGSRLQNYLHVKDAAAMLHVAANSRHSVVVNATANQSYSNRRIAEIVAGQIGDTEILHSQIDTSPSYEYTNDRWNSLFNYNMRVPIEDGIKGLIEDVRFN